MLTGIMRATRSVLFPLVLLLLLASLGLGGCSFEDPYCSSSVDLTGRAIAICRNGREVPVCDEEGEMARYEDDGRGGTVLTGGRTAYCGSEDVVVCANGDAPYCLLNPAL